MLAAPLDVGLVRVKMLTTRRAFKRSQEDPFGRFQQLHVTMSLAMSRRCQPAALTAGGRSPLQHATITSPLSSSWSPLTDGHQDGAVCQGPWSLCVEPRHPSPLDSCGRATQFIPHFDIGRSADIVSCTMVNCKGVVMSSTRSSVTQEICRYCRTVSRHYRLYPPCHLSLISHIVHSKSARTATSLLRARP